MGYQLRNLIYEEIMLRKLLRGSDRARKDIKKLPEGPWKRAIQAHLDYLSQGHKEFMMQYYKDAEETLNTV